MALPLRFALSRGVLTTMSPPIPRAYEWASRYALAPSRPLLDMSQGVPGIPPPLPVQQALGSAAGSVSSFGYSRWDGEPSLRSALAKEMKVVYGQDADIAADDVALTSGCNLAFVAVAMSLADAGDEIILPVPWYFNHQMALNLLGVKPVPLLTRPEDGFRPSVDLCKTLMTPKTKAIVLISPNNPTGAIYPPSLLESFVKLANDSGVALIIDETYRDFIVSESAPHHIFASPSWRSSFIHLFSFSKSYCLPGHRLGAIVGSPTLLVSIKSILDTLQICPPRPIQQALAPLLPSLRPFMISTADELQKRHALFRNSLPEGWKIGAQGGYFAFVRHPFRRVRAADVCRRLAEEIGVVSLPASFFFEERTPTKPVEADVAVIDPGSNWDDIQAKDDVEEEQRWVRFSVGNVDDEKVRRVCERLQECQRVFRWDSSQQQCQFDPNTIAGRVFSSYR